MKVIVQAVLDINESDWTVLDINERDWLGKRFWI